jgi:hypothetical protein
MKGLMSGILAATLAASFAVASVVPLDAAPIFVPKAADATAKDIQSVQYRPEWRRMHRRGGARFYVDNGGGYYNGYRGYRYHRRGYREYNGWWFPAGAFIAGALITGAINGSRSRGDSHVAWCASHYRSYRVADDTWKPNYGPRRPCNSPYD